VDCLARVDLVVLDGLLVGPGGGASARYNESRQSKAGWVATICTRPATITECEGDVWSEN
jgi:hypothetical protein